MMAFLTWLRHLLEDERGQASTARVSFVLTLSITLYLVVAEAYQKVILSPFAFDLLVLLNTILFSWAAGTRFAQYLLPNLLGLLGRGARGVVASAAFVPSETPTEAHEDLACSTKSPPPVG